MRILLSVVLACGFFAAGTTLARAVPPSSLDVTAHQVEFFYDRFIVTADGDVHIRLSDGTVISGETFTMDLKLDRYLVAGDVHIDGPTIHQVGAAFAGYPDLDRSYFLPATASPERYTYFGLDWTDTHTGREQPGDAYNFPDLTAEHPYIKAAGARITPRTNVLFDMPRIYQTGVYVPLPRYVVTFSANPHFFENAFPGARADVGIPFNGSAHSLTALHIRNDAFNGTYLALDQHFVWDQDWIVAAIDPLTQEERQFNIIGYKRFSPKFESRIFLQEQAASAGIINRPENAAAFGEIQLNAGLRRSGLSYTEDNYYNYILGYPPQQNDAISSNSYSAGWRNHPVTMLLSWTGYETRVAKWIPLNYRLRSALGAAHDIYGYGGYPNEQPGPPDSFYHYLGATVYTPTINFGGLGLSLQYDRQRTWFNLPHETDQGDARAAISHVFRSWHVNSFVAYEVKQTGDYWGSQQLEAYPAYSNTVTTPFGTYSGQDAFRGFATSRGYTLGSVYTPTQYFSFNVQLSRFYDFPAPVPGLYGQPPVQLSLDMRIRLARQILLDLSRGYYFNFANERWTPQFGIQFSP